MNWKIIGGALVAAMALVLFAPSWLAALAPLIVFVACPLSMVFMMRHMRGSPASTQTTESDRAEIARLRSEVDRLREQRRSDADRRG